MTRKEIIENGWVEKYVLGLTSEQESSEVERLANLYPEIQDNINETRNKICGKFNRNLTQPALRDTMMNKRKMMTFTVIGVVIFSLGFAFLCREYFSLKAGYTEQGNILAIEEAKLYQMNAFAQSASDLSTFIHASDTKRIKLAGTALFRDAEAMVFRSDKSGRMLFRIVELPALSAGQSYEVWGKQRPKPDRLVGLIKPPLKYDLLYALDSMTFTTGLQVVRVDNDKNPAQVVCEAMLDE
ncbi:MAG: anti-sigma factor [Saprospiraceae bacterium]